MLSSSPPSFAPVNPGDMLFGKYRVERVLGAGGMGIVVAAMHIELGQRVAVKFLNPAVLETPEAVARFTREARAAVRIKSDYVARVIDVGRLENSAPYMVMEYLEGEDLSETLKRGPLPIEDSVDYLIQACDAMAEAHAEGIIHRDLKPANLFLVSRTDGSSSVKVLDFGISKLMVPDVREANLTKTAAIMGSPFYMSPEQLRSSRAVDGRTDIWSLGVILFELLAGQPPFQGETFGQLLAGILTEPPLQLLPLRPDVPVELVAAIARCLEKDRDRRFQNVGELAAALVGFGSRRSRVTAERVLKVVGITSTVESSAKPASLTPPADDLPREIEARTGGTGTSWAETHSGTMRRRGLALAVAAAVLVLLAGAFATTKYLRAGAAEPSASALVASASAAPPLAAAPAPPAVSLAPKEEVLPSPAISPVVSAAASNEPIVVAPAGARAHVAAQPVRMPAAQLAPATASAPAAGHAPVAVPPAAATTEASPHRSLRIDLK